MVIAVYSITFIRFSLDN